MREIGGGHFRPQHRIGPRSRQDTSTVGGGEELRCPIDLALRQRDGAEIQQAQDVQAEGLGVLGHLVTELPQNRCGLEVSGRRALHVGPGDERFGVAGEPLAQDRKT